MVMQQKGRRLQACPEHIRVRSASWPHNPVEWNIGEPMVDSQDAGDSAHRLRVLRHVSTKYPIFCGGANVHDVLSSPPRIAYLGADLTERLHEGGVDLIGL
jgi:hypothetical protein